MKFAETERRQFTTDMRCIVHGWKCRCIAIGNESTEGRKIADIRPLECESAPCLAR